MRIRIEPKDPYKPVQFAQLNLPYRKTNAELCAEFRELLTTKVHFTHTNSDPADPGSRTHEIGLLTTKPWRNELWKAFREIESRLCPVEEDGSPK